MNTTKSKMAAVLVFLFVGICFGQEVEQDPLLSKFSASSGAFKVPHSMVRVMPTGQLVYEIGSRSFPSRKLSCFLLLKNERVQDKLRLEPSERTKANDLCKQAESLTLDWAGDIQSETQSPSQSEQQRDGLVRLERKFESLLSPKQQQDLQAIQNRTVARLLGHHRALTYLCQLNEIPLTKNTTAKLKVEAGKWAAKCRDASKQMIEGFKVKLSEVLEEDQRQRFTQMLETELVFPKYPEILALQLANAASPQDQGGLYDRFADEWRYSSSYVISSSGEISFSDKDLGRVYAVATLVFQLLNGQIDVELELLPRQVELLNSAKKELLAIINDKAATKVQRAKACRKVEGVVEKALVPSQLELLGKRRLKLFVLKRGVPLGLINGDLGSELEIDPDQSTRLRVLCNDYRHHLIAETNKIEDEVLEALLDVLELSPEKRNELAEQMDNKFADEPALLGIASHSLN